MDKRMETKLKSSEQLLKDHTKWLELYNKYKSSNDERPQGKDYDLRFADLNNAKLTNAKLNNANLMNAKIDVKWKDYIQSQNVIGFDDIEWVGTASDEKLDKYAKLVDRLKVKGFNNSDIIKIIEALDE